MGWGRQPRPYKEAWECLGGGACGHGSFWKRWEKSMGKQQGPGCSAPEPDAEADGSPCGVKCGKNTQEGRSKG